MKPFIAMVEDKAQITNNLLKPVSQERFFFIIIFCVWRVLAEGTSSNLVRKDSIKNMIERDSTLLPVVMLQACKVPSPEPFKWR